MNLQEQAEALDKQAQVLAKRMTSDFIKIGRVMDEMTDERQLFRLLNFDSQEAWVISRFRSQRATAFEARRIYRVLHLTVPESVLEFMEPGTLKVMAELPASAQRKVEVQQQALTSPVGEFTDSMLQKYPDHLMEKRVSWTLNPTMSQAQLYNRVMEQIQRWFGEGEVISRETAMELLFKDCEENMASKGATPSCKAKQ